MRAAALPALSRKAAAAALVLTVSLSHASAQPAQTPPDHLAIAQRLDADLRACLGRAQGRFQAALACNNAVLAGCLRDSPHGETTAGLAICSGVAATLLDADMNVVWAVMKARADRPTFAAILSEQRAWLRQRDRDSRAARDRNAGGSMAAYSGGISYVGMSAERLARLHEIAAGL